MLDIFKDECEDLLIHESRHFGEDIECKAQQGKQLVHPHSQITRICKCRWNWEKQLCKASSVIAQASAVRRTVLEVLFQQE